MFLIFSLVSGRVCRVDLGGVRWCVCRVVWVLGVVRVCSWVLVVRVVCWLVVIVLLVCEKFMKFMLGRLGLMMMFCGLSLCSECCMFCLVRICSIWLVIVMVFVILWFLSSGVLMLMVMMMLVLSVCVRFIGRLCIRLLFISGWLLMCSGVNIFGMVMEVCSVWKRGVLVWFSMVFESRLVVMVWKGMGSLCNGFLVCRVGSSDDSVVFSWLLVVVLLGSMVLFLRLKLNLMCEGRCLLFLWWWMDRWLCVGWLVRMVF